MDRDVKQKAIRMLREKKGGSRVTYEQIAEMTGYSVRQLYRISDKMDREGDAAALEHAAAGRRSNNAASEDELRIIRETKAPYPTITIRHFHDIYQEDVIENPDRRDDVERYGLVARSESWFRQLFRREGWSSPLARRPRGAGEPERHPRRRPMPRRGMMCQVDATPYDWLTNGRVWNMHLAVDDATTDVLGGWFMEQECMRGYARMMAQVVTRHGVPASMYSDKDAVFRAVKDGSPTQFAHMMRDLNVRMIFANSAEAKGRVERHGFTAQNRLPNDAIRFGIRDYDTLNAWFNEFYAPYLNTKFSFAPEDPEPAFAALPDGTDLSRVFRTRETRTARRGTISYARTLYMLVDADGVIWNPGEGVKVSVHVDCMTEEMYAERNRRRYSMVPIESRERPQLAGVQDRRDLQRLLSDMTREGAMRSF